MRKAFPSFLIQLLVLSVAAYAILSYSDSLSFVKVPPVDVDIKITSGNINNHRLILSPSGTVDVFKNKKVTWLIDPSAANVVSFSIKKKPVSVDVFDTNERPPSSQTRGGYGRVKSSAIDGQVYEYSILWKGTDSDTIYHTFDPKIAIKPSTFTFLGLITLIGYGIGVLILSVIFINKTIKSRKI